MSNDPGLALPGDVAGTPSATQGRAWIRIAKPALKTAAVSWFAVAVLGQLMMAVFVIGFYGRAAARGDFAVWNKVLAVGYVPGDTIGNVVLSLHLAFVTVVIVSGALQLVPAMRRIAPRFHHWNGKLYIASALVMSIGGLIMLWMRETVGDLSQHVAISINGDLIIVFSAMTLRHAMARRFDVHRRMALRCFSPWAVCGSSASALCCGLRSIRVRQDSIRSRSAARR